MKTGEAAKILGVDRNTIYNWTQNPDLSRFFSPGARMEDGTTQRILTESDLLILNSIRAKRSEGIVEWDEIARILDDGYRAREFPQNAISADPRTVSVPQAEQSAMALGTLRERDTALARIDELNEEVEELKALTQRLQQEKEEAVQRLQEEKAALHESLLREIADLNKQIGRLEGRLEALRPKE